MGNDDLQTEKKAIFTLAPLPKRERNDPASAVIRDSQAFADFILLKNIRWFVKLRWTVVGTLLAIGFASFAGLLDVTGLHFRWQWAVIPAVFLAIANYAYRQHHHRLSLSDSGAMKINIWIQILIDLVAVTWVVHISGSLSSFAPFLYVLHITLSCVFLGARSSLKVLLCSAVLYSSCLVLEANGVIQEHSVFGIQIINWRTSTLIVHAASAIVIWWSVWYLVGNLAGVIRDRDRMLVDSHRRIRSTFEASRQHMYTTAHQMKSPLAAISTVIQTFRFLVSEGQDPAPDEYFMKIDQRSRALMDQVRDILQLANLQAGESVTREFKDVKIGKLLTACIKSLESNATGRKVDVETAIADFSFFGDADALRIIFENLVSNAINYSFEGAKINIECNAPENGKGGTVIISDHGIGIPEEKLPHIFDDYFRTSEAKKHCQLSTGLGLAIVKEAAAFHEIAITVESTQGAGTSFILKFPLSSRE